MTTQQMQISVRTFEPRTTVRHMFTTGYHAIWVKQGTVLVAGAHIETGQGVFAMSDADLEATGPNSAKCLCFSLQAAPTSQTPILVQHVQIPTGQAVFRLDQVSFPRGAIAYRHVHAGAGIRYLLQGSLSVQSDHGTELMQPGDAWFEDKNAPVRAVASETEETEFIRASILPEAYLTPILDKTLASPVHYSTEFFRSFLIRFLRYSLTLFRRGLR